MEKQNGNGNGYAASKSISSTLKQFVAIGFRHRLLMRSAFLWSLLAALLVVFFFGLKWESDFEVLVRHDRVEPAVTPDNSPRPQYPPDNQSTTIDITNESELLQSHDLLQKVVDACPMLVWGEPKFYRPYLLKVTGLIPGYNESKNPKAVTKLGSDLQVNVIGNTGILQVTYSSSDPLQSACVTQNLAKLYITKHLAVNRMPRVFDFFARQTDIYHQQLLDAETKLLDFARTQNAVQASNEVNMAVEKGSQFEADLHTAQKNADATQQRLTELQNLKTALPARLTTQIRSADNGTLLANLKSTLNTLELQRTALVAKYDPSYRLVQDIDTQITQTKAAIESQEKAPLNDNTTDQNPTYTWTEGEVAKAQADLAAYKAQVAADSNIVSKYHDKAVAFDAKSVTQDDLTREVKAAEQNYLLYLAKREQARIQDMLDERRILNISTMAEPPTTPVLTNYSPVLLLVLAFMFAAFVAAGSALIADYLDPSFRTPDEVKEFLEVPVFASIPENGFEVPVGSVRKNGH